jgi:FtsH-binding integral membrane protein
MIGKFLNSMSAEVWQLAFIILLASICYLAEMFTRAMPKTAVILGVLLLGSPVYLYFWLASLRINSDGSAAALFVWLVAFVIGILLFGLGIFMIRKGLRQTNLHSGTSYIYGQSEGFRFNDPNKISKS